jgi:hypothetical protein
VAEIALSIPGLGIELARVSIGMAVSACLETNLIDSVLTLWAMARRARNVRVFAFEWKRRLIVKTAVEERRLKARIHVAR